MIITPQEALTRCIEHREIFHDEVLHLMRLIVRGEMSPVMATTLTMGPRIKREIVGEAAAAATVMREFATKVDVPAEVPDHFVDIIGMGGDGTNTFNISITSMLVVATTGAHIAKHGGRGISSKSGSADALEALSVNIMFTSEQVAESIETVDIGFIFTPNRHPAMKNVAPIRKELGVRMIFNILGPLTNPAGTPSILTGVFHPDLVGIQARVMRRPDTKHAVVVCGRNGTDKVSLGAATLIGELRGGVVTEYEIHPEDSGPRMVSNRSPKVADADESRAMLIEAPEDKPGMPHEIVLFNAGAVLYTANIAGSIGDGMKLAREAIASGIAYTKLDELVRVTDQFKA